MHFARCCLLAITALAPSLGWTVTKSDGCSNSNPTVRKSGTYTISQTGLWGQAITRTYRVFVPSTYTPTKTHPVVVLFHGWGGGENELLGNRTVTRLAEQRGYILVAPRGLGSAYPDSNPNSWSFSGSTTGLDGSPDGSPTAYRGGAKGAICDPSSTPNYTNPSCNTVALNTCSWTQCQADDVAFTLALVDYVSGQFCVDKSRVFASGGSNGGMFSWELGQNPSSAQYFRAIAPLIGLPHRAYLNPQGNGTEMPVLVITGTRDTTVPPGAWENPSYTTTSDGDRYYYTGGTAITRSWGTLNNCSYNPGVPAKAFNDGNAQTDCRTYCSNGSGWSKGSVNYSGAAGGGWPKVLDCRAAMGHSYSLNWSWKLILDFFDAHSP